VSNNKDSEVTSLEVDNLGVDNSNNSGTNFTYKPKILVSLGVLSNSSLIIKLELYKDSKSKGIYLLLARSKLSRV